MSRQDRGSRLYLLLACLAAALGGLLFGFDTAVISGAIDPLESYFQLSSWMKGWIVSSALIGCLIGSAVAGTLSDRFGRKRILLLAAFLFIICAIGSAIPQAPWHLVVARLIGGAGIGIASMLSPMYIAEISPARLRGSLISVYQLAITIGILVAYLSNYGLAEAAQRWTDIYGSGIWRIVFVDQLWRGMLLAGLLPAGFLLSLLLFVPESPRWLAEQGQSAAALAILTNVNGLVAAKAELTEIESVLSQEDKSIDQLFQRGRKLPLFIGILLPFFSQISGINVIVYYGPTVLKTAGWGENAALFWQILFGIVSAASTVLAILMIDRLGRKPLLLFGIAGVGIMLTIAGTLMSYENVSPLGLIVVFALDLAFFNVSYGPICWVIVSEIFPTSIRGRAMSISIFSLWTGCTLVAQTFPPLLEMVGVSWVFWVYAMTTLPAFFFVLLLVPETKGETLEQIEMRFVH